MTAKQAKPRGRPRDPEHARQRAAAILDLATAHFAQRGFQGTDVQVLADALGVGKGTVYRYFPSKRELFLATLDEGMTRMHKYVEAERVRETDPLDQVKRAIEAYLAFFDTYPEYVELLIQERAVFKNRKKPTYFVHREKNVGRWRELFRGLIAAGRVRPLPPERITNVLSNMLYGTMFTNYFAGRRQSLESQARELLDVALRGILSDKERRRRPARRRRDVKGKEPSA